MIGILIFVTIFTFLNYVIQYGNGLDGKKSLYLEPLSNYPKNYASILQIRNLTRYVLPIFAVGIIVIYFLRDKKK